MKQFSRLLYFEWKKIYKRKSTWITLGILILFYLVMDSFSIFGSTYVEGEFLETHLEGAKIDAENGRRLSGRQIDNALLQEMQDAYAKYSDANDVRYMLSEEYQQTVRPYSLIYRMLSDMFIMQNMELPWNQLIGEKLYEIRNEYVSDMWNTYRLTDSEKAYWQKKEDQLEKPFTYQYAAGYKNMTSMSGAYRVSLLVTFLIAICMSAVFTEEHGRKTDQLILCTRFGRKQLYFAKILAGSLYALFATGVLFLLATVWSFFLYGTDGFSASIQLWAGHYSYPLTAGQAFLILTGILFLSSVLIGIFTMVLSELTNSNIAAMAVVIAGMFAARLIPVPFQYRAFSQLWNYFPINLLKFDAGFWDIRLVSIFGIKFTIWQFAPVLYVGIIVVLIWIGRRIYCRYQVQS